jgi:hypothetical protein
LPDPAPTFDPRRFQQQVAATDTVRRTILAAVVIGWGASLLQPLATTIWPVALMGGGIILWLLASHASARTTRLALQAAQHAAATDQTARLEDTLARGLKRFTLYRSIRVMLYHHLAVLRARQGRDAEAAAICAALLAGDLVPRVSGQRGKLLLLFTEVTLRAGGLWDAWAALGELAGLNMPLNDRLKRLELQTRYEAACGRWDRMLRQLPSKVQLSELMPAEESAAMQRRLLDAADRAGFAATAAWLRARAELLQGDRRGAGETFAMAESMPGLAEPT